MLFHKKSIQQIKHFNRILIECCVISSNNREFSRGKCCSYVVHVRVKILHFLSRRNLDHFQNLHLSSMTSVDADTGNGEVTIRLPPETYPIISGITQLNNLLNSVRQLGRHVQCFTLNCLTTSSFQLVLKVLVVRKQEITCPNVFD